MFISSWLNEALHCGYLFKIKIWWYWWPFGDFSSPEKFSSQSILALNYFSIFISSYILLQIVCLAILICLDPLLLPTHINARAFAALLSCSVTNTVGCCSHQSSSYHQTLHPLRRNFSINSFRKPILALFFLIQTM